MIADFIPFKVGLQQQFSICYNSASFWEITYIYLNRGFIWSASLKKKKKFCRITESISYSVVFHGFCKYFKAKWSHANVSVIFDGI